MKTRTVLELYVRFRQGEMLDKEQVSKEYDIVLRTFYRYVKQIREFCADHGEGDLVCDKESGRYYLKKEA
ncbi:MAG: hypothetical protein MRZ13_03495 [Clostridiales bacterium]|nr:hypothetical protein [Clostridiales bacterium]MDY4894627.1 hypothetical protein [Christensenellaceae bacterium]